MERSPPEEEGIHEQSTIIGIHLAKRVFQMHGAAAHGSVVFRKKRSRGQLLSILAAQPRSVMAMDACATAHGWGREFMKLGHEVRLLPTIYVKLCKRGVEGIWH